VSEQKWYKICYNTWALPIPGAGVIVRHCVYRYVQTVGDLVEVPEGTSLVFVPGTMLQRLSADPNAEVQVVVPGPGDQQGVGTIVPCVP
jgi:hypothetical protein